MQAQFCTTFPQNCQLLTISAKADGVGAGCVSAVDSSMRTMCSGSDKTVKNLTDCTDRNRAGQTLRKDLTGWPHSVWARIPLVIPRIETRKRGNWYERDREMRDNGPDKPKPL